jgi:hypothetical protein
VKQFFLVAAAMFVGTWAAIFTYEKWLVEPRRARDAASVVATIDSLNAEVKRLRELVVQEKEAAEAKKKLEALEKPDPLWEALKSGAPIKDVVPKPTKPSR